MVRLNKESTVYASHQIRCPPHQTTSTISLFVDPKSLESVIFTYTAVNWILFRPSNLLLQLVGLPYMLWAKQVLHDLVLRIKGLRTKVTTQFETRQSVKNREEKDLRNFFHPQTSWELSSLIHVLDQVKKELACFELTGDACHKKKILKSLKAIPAPGFETERETFCHDAT